MPQHVLVIDDDMAIRRLMRLALRDAGYVTHEAADGVSAWERLQVSDEPLVAVLDLRLPRMDGRQLLETVAVDEMLVTRHTYILTGADTHGLPTSLAQLLTRLSVPVLEKPFSLDTLLDVIAQATARLAIREITHSR